ncbi:MULTISPECIES: FHA domain-containing protein [unclassified Microbacterium]|uniref:FHA domain-containing protein n=1 Tax=Microbacterium TaxID=33882 RepID=UPI003BA030DC
MTAGDQREAAADTIAPTGDGLGDHDGATISAADLRGLRGDHDGTTIPRGERSAAPTRTARARIRLSSGEVVALDRPIVIGRRPRATRSTGAELPHLVSVESPSLDISRSHVEVIPDADSVVVVDLHSTNGTTLLRGGEEPVQLHPGEHTVVVTGDVVDLGDGVSFAFEDLP